MAKVEFV